MESFASKTSSKKARGKSLDQELVERAKAGELKAFEELMNHARRHASAGSNMSNPNPFEPVVMSILVEHEKTLRKLREHVEREHN